ncbi:MAG: hypothetical protein JWR84_3260 [Caulobacter sp.]|nr:hypothetical protein [Caulobacter sp.]
MADDIEFTENGTAYDQKTRLSNLQAYVRQTDDNRLLSDDPRALIALAALVYKSNHPKPSGPLESPAPGKLYGPNDALPGSGVSLPKPPNKKNGYDGVAFYRPTARELILVNRGTETQADWIGNARAGLAGWIEGSSPALDYAKECVETLRKAGVPISQVTCTGHSLGGALAEIQATFLNAVLDNPVQVRAVGFASVGFPKAIAAIESDRKIKAAKSETSCHYVRRNDPIRLLYVGDKPRFEIKDIDTSIYEIIRRRPEDAPDHTEYYIDDGFFSHSSYLYFHLWDKPTPAHFLKTFGGTFRAVDPSSLGKLPHALGVVLASEYQ